jgi:hypothetical protein
MSAHEIQFEDAEGQAIGGLVLLDQGNRQLRCDWFGVCGNQAVIAVSPSTRGAAPQLACPAHLPNIFLSIWKTRNPPRLRVRDGSALLARNDQVGR